MEYSTLMTHSSYSNNRSSNSKRSNTLRLSCLPLLLNSLICTLAMWRSSWDTRRYIYCMCNLWPGNMMKSTSELGNSNCLSQYSSKFSLRCTKLIGQQVMEESNNMML